MKETSNQNKEEKVYPVGIGARVDEVREKLPSIELQNEVIWANSVFEGKLPLDIHFGEKTNIGRFITNGTGNLLVEVDTISRSGRSSLLGRAVFEDTDANKYRDIGTKGTGFFMKTGNRLSVMPILKGTSRSDSRGICNKKEAFIDANYSEKFYKYGIRVPRPIAIIELKEIIDSRDRIMTIEEAKDEDVIHELEEPVVYVRAFGVETRLSDLMLVDIEKRQILLDDARKFIAQEFGFEEQSFGEHNYLIWLSENLGRDIGLLHKNKFVHQNFSNHHNFTADGRIVDFDTIKETDEKFRIEHDWNQAFRAYVNFLSIILKGRDDEDEIIHQYADIAFTGVYNKALKSK